MAKAETFLFKTTFHEAPVQITLLMEYRDVNKVKNFIQLHFPHLVIEHEIEVSEYDGPAWIVYDQGDLLTSVWISAN